jgi:hypothetical protein
VIVGVRRTIDHAGTACPIKPLPLAEIEDNRPEPLSPKTIARLERVLACLPSQWRRAYKQDIQGATREEIARSGGKSPQTIHYWLAEARDWPP